MYFPVCLFLFSSFVGLRPLAPAVVVRISKESTGVLVQFKDDLEYISNPIRPFRGVYFSEVVLAFPVKIGHQGYARDRL